MHIIMYLSFRYHGRGSCFGWIWFILVSGGGCGMFPLSEAGFGLWGLYLVLRRSLYLCTYTNCVVEVGVWIWTREHMVP